VDEYPGWIGRVYRRTEVALGYGLRSQEASVVRGLVLRDRSLIPDNLDEAFRRSGITQPLPAYAPELDPVERWFQELRRESSNERFETIKLLQEALNRTLSPYWDDRARLRRLTGFSWWVEAVDAL
jgi:hypothetical protein